MTLFPRLLPSLWVTKPPTSNHWMAALLLYYFFRQIDIIFNASEAIMNMIETISKFVMISPRRGARIFDSTIRGFALGKS